LILGAADRPHRIFKKTDPSSAGVKAAPTCIKFQTKIWVMAAANHGAVILIAFFAVSGLDVFWL
jgi:hypothetical protein